MMKSCMEQEMEVEEKQEQEHIEMGKRGSWREMRRVTMNRERSRR
jgi:hypothetical protein